MPNDNEQAIVSSNELHITSLPPEMIFVILSFLDDIKDIVKCRRISIFFRNLIDQHTLIQRIVEKGKEEAFHELHQLYADKLPELHFSPRLFSAQHRKLKALDTNTRALKHRQKNLEELRAQKEKYKYASGFGGVISIILLLSCFLVNRYFSWTEPSTTTNSTLTESIGTTTNNDILPDTFSQNIMIGLGLLGFVVSLCLSCFSFYKTLRIGCTIMGIQNNEEVERGLIQHFPSKDSSSPRAPLLSTNSSPEP